MNDGARTVSAIGDVLRSADLLTEIRGPEDVVVSGVTQDSRSVREGDLFLAWRGTGVDAHDFIPAAVESGAVATVVERPVDVSVPQLVVTNGRRAAALAADAVLGSPSRALLTVGVTGTNGKTTTALLVRHILGGEHEAATIGTLGVVGRDGVWPGTEGLTTPGPVRVATWLREIVDRGGAAVVLEASSHALEQHRLDAVSFSVGVFTNLTQDHLDYHGDMPAYRAAKLRLIELVRPDGTVVVNVADPAWADLSIGRRTLLRYGIDADADVRATSLGLGPSGTSFDLHAAGETRRVRLPLVGRYNVENALAAAAAALAAGVGPAQIAERLSGAPQVAGRLESVVNQPFSVLIDFAHTPAALENALAALRPLVTGRLIVVFGAGGDRDRTKRRPMAEAVSRIADVVVLTSDNPRTEDPEAIIDDLVEGMGEVAFLREADRRRAIRAALGEARPGDTVVLAGKGHETYQVIGTEKLPFEERRIVADVLREMRAS